MRASLNFGRALQCVEWTMTQRPALDVRGEIKSIRRRKRRAEIRGALVLARNMAGTITAIHARASTPKKKVVSGSPLVECDFRDVTLGQARDAGFRCGRPGRVSFLTAFLGRKTNDFDASSRTFR
jgi:hypothetical protein